jgi:hypothetical protein
MVGRAGIEPALPKKQDFKSCVSTNFTTAPHKRKATVFLKTHIKDLKPLVWRREPESNRRRRSCSPLHNHSTIAPRLSN